MECKLFHKEIAEGIYRISDALHGPNEDGYSEQFGAATQNSYLITGANKAALIDLAVDTKELYSYAKKLARVPVTVLLTHGHPDHIYHLKTVPEAWIHPADEGMVTLGLPGISLPVTEISLHPLQDGQVIDLGDRKIEVLALPGHTMGSVLFLDYNTGTVLAGDTCARRLLYGVTPTITLEEHCRHLEGLMNRDFKVIYTAHDRAGLPKDYLQTILNGIRTELPKATETVEIPGVGTMKNLHLGKEDTMGYFDMAVMQQYLSLNRTLRISHLRTLHRENPVGIDTNPYFSWMLCSEENNVYQKAYRILVCHADETVWDSGYVASDKQTFVPYEGRCLKSRTRYTWEVTVWDTAGNIGTGAGFFETAFLNTAEWKACWIESDFERPVTTCEPFWNLKPPVYFEKQFQIDGIVKKARLYATAHGIYHVYANGKRPDDREFAPEHTVYDKILYYQTYAMEDFLRQGENRITFIVADGWYFCPQTKQEIEKDTGRPAVLFQLEVEYEDGRTQIICSDGSECSYIGQYVYADLFLGEKQDASLKRGESHPVITGEFSVNVLEAQPMEPVRPVELLPATQVYRSPKGEWIVDFGQIVCGRARIRVDLPKDTEAVFEYFEVTDLEGNYKNTMIAPQRDVYKSNGTPSLYEAAFTFHGFRYIRVSGMDKVNQDDFTAVVLSTEKESIGSFNCSDEKLNRLYQNIRWSQTNNMLSIPTDCPSREKGGFTGDIQIYAKTAMLNEQMAPFLTSWLKNLTAAQARNGAVPITVPQTAPYKRLMVENAKAFGDEWPVGVAGWSDAAVIVPYEMYLATGNTLILEQQYDSMKRWCDYIINASKDHRGAPEMPEELDRLLWNTGFHFGEWLIPNEKKNMTHKEACEGSAFYIAPIFSYISFYNMTKIAQVLKKEEAAFYEEHAKQIKNAIQKALIRNGQMNTDNMGAYVLMIAFDLIPEELFEQFGNKLVELLNENDGCLNTGFLATPYLLDAFAKIGRKDLASSLLWQTRQPSWLYEVLHGATAIWESWDAVLPGKEPAVTSYDHYAFGCVDAWIFENVVGIRSLEPGFKRIEIRPEPEQIPLDFCRRSFLCEYGLIEVYWTKDVLRVSIPCGVSATVCWKGRKYETGSGNYEYR